MVDVQMSNLKLQQRARNIVRTIDPPSASLPDSVLDTTIASCDGSVKLTLMHLMSGLPVEDSRRTLAENGGVLKRALEAWQEGTEQGTVTPASSVDENVLLGEEAAPEDLVLAIDGGGSKCGIAVTGRSGVVGRADGEACNFTDAAPEVLKGVIARTALRAMEDYHAKSGNKGGKGRVTQVLAGMSGFDRPGARDVIVPLLKEVFALESEESVAVMADTNLLASILTKYPECRKGVVLIAGTGSVAMSFARESAADGFTRTGRSGGWGHILGDEGSGFDIGRKGVRAALRAVERRRILADKAEPLSAFQTAVVQHLAGEDATTSDVDLLSATLRQPSGEPHELKGRLAALSPIVLAHMKTDAEAAKIASDAADSLVEVLQHVLVAGATGEEVLLMSGGVMKCEPYRSLVLQKSEEVGLKFKGVEVVEEPASSAVQALSQRRSL
jgi:N-acetylmuramic acid 6-phosphate etherase